MPTSSYVEMPTATFEATRLCRACGVEKSTEECFRLLKTYRGNKRYTCYARRCKNCDVLARDKWLATKPEKAEMYSHRFQVARYGLTPLEYAELLLAQAEVCAICRGPQQGTMRMCVDHDHTTGVVRGLLCSRCNKGVGNFEDDPERLLAAAAYLRGGE